MHRILPSTTLLRACGLIRGESTPTTEKSDEKAASQNDATPTTTNADGSSAGLRSGFFSAPAAADAFADADRNNAAASSRRA